MSIFSNLILHFVVKMKRTDYLLRWIAVCIWSIQKMVEFFSQDKHSNKKIIQSFQESTRTLLRNIYYTMKRMTQLLRWIAVCIWSIKKKYNGTPLPRLFKITRINIVGFRSFFFHDNLFNKHNEQNNYRLWERSHLIV